jgi:hypothetical protein
MWMGGNVPLGYDANERTLVINPAEAETVRRVFALYRELGCVRRVKEEADRLGTRTKCSTTANGTERRGKPFSRGHLYRLLANPIYTGRIAHKGRLYPGQHPALLDDETWTAVQDQLAAQAREPSVPLRAPIVPVKRRAPRRVRSRVSRPTPRQMPTTCGRGTESLQTHRRRRQSRARSLAIRDAGRTSPSCPWRV